MNYVPGAVTPLKPEKVQIGDAVGHRAWRRGLRAALEVSCVASFREPPFLRLIVRHVTYTAGKGTVIST